MTERMVEDLHSDVWGIGKSDFTEYTPEEELREWREAVKVLDGFCQVADGLNHSPLILALVDAKVRAEEELARAQDRVERPEGVEVSPRERERVSALLTRSDALSNAIGVRERYDPQNGWATPRRWLSLRRCAVRPTRPSSATRGRSASGSREPMGPGRPKG
jgi:hypothetical protein